MGAQFVKLGNIQADAHHVLAIVGSCNSHVSQRLFRQIFVSFKDTFLVKTSSNWKINFKK